MTSCNIPLIIHYVLYISVYANTPHFSLRPMSILRWWRAIYPKSQLHSQYRRLDETTLQGEFSLLDE